MCSEGGMNVSAVKNIFWAAAVFLVIFSAYGAFAACGNSAVPQEIASFEDVRYIEISADVREEFSVTVDSNPTTGYMWKIYGKIPAEITALDDEFIPPKSKLLGAPGRQVFRFRALAKGSFTVILRYARPWDEENPAAFAVCEITVR